MSLVQYTVSDTDKETGKIKASSLPERSCLDGYCGTSGLYEIDPAPSGSYSVRFVFGRHETTLAYLVACVSIISRVQQGHRFKSRGYNNSVLCTAGKEFLGRVMMLHDDLSIFSVFDNISKKGY